MLEVIIDYGSAFDTYGKVTETKSSRKESSFPDEEPLIKLIGAANFQSPVIARKISASVPQEHQIRMCSDERDKLHLEIITCNQSLMEVDSEKSNFFVWMSLK